MQSPTYKDIIDEKIAEWQRSLKKLEQQKEKASAEDKKLLTARAEKLTSAIDEAIVQLHNLDKNETAKNTMETKDKILKIFSSIDKDLIEYQEKTPFML